MCAWATSAGASSATAALGELRLGAAPRAGAGLALVLLAALWALTATLASPESFVRRNLFYRFDLTLSEAVAISFQDMRDHAFSVTNGYMAEATRIHMDRRTEAGQERLYSNHWRMTVVADNETKPVTVTLRGNRPCSEQGALCDGTVQLTNAPTLTLTPDTAPFDGSNLPSLSIANASATEDTSVLNFDVTLSRATQSHIAFDYRTIAGGTATANADYRPVVDTRMFIPPGETTVAAPVRLIEDTASDAGETARSTLASEYPFASRRKMQ